MKQTLLDRFFIWLDGDKSVLVSLAMIPVSLVFIWLTNNHVKYGTTLWALGGWKVESDLDIFTIASLGWAATTFWILEALRVKSNLLELLACAATFVVAMYCYLFV